MTEPKKRLYVVRLARDVASRHFRTAPGGSGAAPYMPRDTHITDWYSIDQFGMLCFRVDEREIHVPLHMLISITELVE